MGFIDDSDSDNDGSDSSDDEIEITTATGTGKGKVDVSQFVNKKKASLDDYAAFKGEDGDDADAEVASKMKELLQLRDAMGMDKDMNFLAKQAEKQIETDRVKSLSQEDRMKEDRDNSGDMMAKIRARQAELSKKKSAGDAKKVAEEPKESDEAALKRVKKEKKKKKLEQEKRKQLRDAAKA